MPNSPDRSGILALHKACWQYLVCNQLWSCLTWKEAAQSSNWAVRSHHWKTPPNKRRKKVWFHQGDEMPLKHTVILLCYHVEEQSERKRGIEGRKWSQEKIMTPTWYQGTIHLNTSGGSAVHTTLQISAHDFSLYSKRYKKQQSSPRPPLKLSKVWGCITWRLSFPLLLWDNQ